MILVYGSRIWTPDAFNEALAARLGDDLSRVVMLDARQILRDVSSEIITRLAGADRVASGVVPAGAIDWVLFEDQRRDIVHRTLEEAVVQASAAGKHVLVIGDDASKLSDIPSLCRTVFYVNSDVNDACNEINSRRRRALESEAAAFAAYEAAARTQQLDPRFYAFMAEVRADFGAAGRWPLAPAEASDAEASAAISANERQHTNGSAAQAAEGVAAAVRGEAPVLDLAAMRETATVKKLLRQIVSLMLGMGANWWFDGFNAAADALLAREQVTILDLAQSQLGVYLGILADWYARY